jgi:transcriptional regulator with XRE-family HTH domain
MDEGTIGARLRILRRWRGMTQAELAGLAGLSPSFVSMVENGQRPLDRRSHVAAIASALRLSETDLTGGPHLSSDRLQSDPHTVIPALRLALQTNSLTSPAVDRARPLADLAGEMSDTILPLHRVTCDYIRSGALLAPLIDELHLHTAQPADEAAHKLALETLVEACVLANSMAWGLNYFDLAHLAALRATEASDILGDPVSQGKAAYARLLSLPRYGLSDRKLQAAERAANDLQPHVRDTQGASVLGMISLGAALAAAAIQRSDTAGHWLSEAQSLAARVPDEPARNWEQFSATNAGVWGVAISVECGAAGGSVLDRARTVTIDRLEPRSSRRAAFFADVGRGVAREPRMRGEAVRWLRRAEETAPQWIRNSTATRDTVAYLLNRARAESGGRELRGMAARMGVPR